MTCVTLIKVSYTLHVIIIENNIDYFFQELCERNLKENLNPHTNINVQTNTNKQTQINN